MDWASTLLYMHTGNENQAILNIAWICKVPIQESSEFLKVIKSSERCQVPSSKVGKPVRLEENLWGKKKIQSTEKKFVRPEEDSWNGKRTLL